MRKPCSLKMKDLDPDNNKIMDFTLRRGIKPLDTHPAQRFHFED